MTVKDTRVDWIDHLKGLAIIGVVTNHLYGISFNSVTFRNLTGFSVPLFILLAGYTSAISISRGKKYSVFLKSRFKNILIPYFLVSIFYQLTNSQHPTSIKLLLVNLSTFSANPVLYFVFFYLQLILVGPIIFTVLNKSNSFKKIFWLVLIFLLSLSINRYFNFNSLLLPQDKTIGGVYINGYILGANKLLGGSYLFLFSLGIYSKLEEITGKILARRKLFFALGLLTIISIFITKQQEMWSNPPNIWLIFYSISMFVITVILVSLKINCIGIFSKYLKMCGQYSLYIFLLHQAFLGVANTIFINSQNFTDIAVLKIIYKQIIFYIFALFGPVLAIKTARLVKTKAKIL